MNNKTAWIIVLVVIFIMAVPALYGNIVAKRGGIMDDAIMNTADPYCQMNQKVKALSVRGLETSEQVALIIPFKAGLEDGLRQVAKITERIQEFYPDFGVMSLSTATHYQDIDGELKTNPYVTENKPNKADIDSWKKEVKQDPGVYGLLIGKDFNYAQIILFLPVDFDEDATFWRIVEMLEDRSISKIERYFKSNIQPVGDFVGILPAGWVMGRGLIDAALLSDVLKLSTLGLILAAMLFFIQLRSIQQSIIAVTPVALSFWLTRGAIGLMQIIGINIYERVYILLVFTGLIIAGISFAEHKFASYQNARKKLPDASRAEVWRLTKNVHEMIFVTAVIAIFNFITLYQIGVRGVMEIGVLSTIGIIILLPLTFWFMPALHIIIGGEAKKKKISRISKWWNILLQGVINNICRLLKLEEGQRFNYERRSWQASIFIIVFFAMATVLVLSGGLIVRTKPLEYINGTTIHQASEFLQKPNHYGFDRISILLRPKNPINTPEIYEPDFIADVKNFQKTLQKLPNFREVNSILNTSEVIARESYGREMQTRQEAHDIFELIAWDLNPIIQSQLWFDGGLVVFASTNTMDDSNAMGKSCEAILETAKQFPNLEILLFGKLPAYPRVDKSIREGKPVNLLTSLWLVALIYFIWIIARNRGKKGTRLIAWRTSIVMTVPVFLFATSVITIIMIILRVPLDQATACVTALAINAAADFGLYPMAEFRNLLQQGVDTKTALRQSLQGEGKIVLNDIMLNCLCFAPLMFSSFIPITRLGWVMIIMLLACGFGALVLSPAILPWCVKQSQRNSERI